MNLTGPAFYTHTHIFKKQLKFFQRHFDQTMLLCKLVKRLSMLSKRNCEKSGLSISLFNKSYEMLIITTNNKLNNINQRDGECTDVY